MIIKTTDANDTLPIGLYKYTDNNSKVQYLNNLKGDKLVSKFNGKKLTRLAELFIKTNDNEYQALDNREPWGEFESQADKIGIEEEEILSTTKYTYDTGYIAYSGSGYDCPVYKKDSATGTVKITSLESKNLYVYQKQKTEIHTITTTDTTFNVNSTDADQYMIIVNFSDTTPTVSGKFNFDSNTVSQYLYANGTTSDVGTNNNALLAIENETETKTIKFTATNKNISNVTVIILYNIYAIVDFTGRNAPNILYGCPVDKNKTEDEALDHWYILGSKLDETVETTSIIKLVNKTN